MASVVIVQARMGASRLPNKMMLYLHGLPIIGWVLQRVRQARQVDRIVFAIPDGPSDDILAEYLEQQCVSVVRGSERDVLGRFYVAATLSEAETVIRVCADNPMVSGSEIDRIITIFKQGKYDYAYNHIPLNNRYPDGLGAEVTSISVLETLNREATLVEHREHVFNYLWTHRGRFRVGTCDPEDEDLACPELKFDIDTMEDYLRLLRLNMNPDSSAKEIVKAALTNLRRET